MPHKLTRLHFTRMLPLMILLVIHTSEAVLITTRYGSDVTTLPSLNNLTQTYRFLTTVSPSNITPEAYPSPSPLNPYFYYFDVNVTRFEVVTNITNHDITMILTPIGSGTPEHFKLGSIGPSAQNPDMRLSRSSLLRSAPGNTSLRFISPGSIATYDPSLTSPPGSRAMQIINCSASTPPSELRSLGNHTGTMTCEINAQFTDGAEVTGAYLTDNS